MVQTKLFLVTTISELFSLFHCFVYLCQYHTILTTVAL